MEKVDELIVASAVKEEVSKRKTPRLKVVQLFAVVLAKIAAALSIDTEGRAVVPAPPLIVAYVSVTPPLSICPSTVVVSASASG